MKDGLVGSEMCIRDRSLTTLITVDDTDSRTMCVRDTRSRTRGEEDPGSPPKSQSSQTHSFWALCRSGSWSSSSCASGAWGQRSLKNQSKQFADRITTANARKTFRECSLVQVDACPSGRFALFSACTLLGAVGLQQLKEKNTHNTKSPHPISPLIRGPSRV